MKYRTTTEVLRSGQPRAYADTEYVCRVTFEHTDRNVNATEFKPFFIARPSALRMLSKVDGWISTTKAQTSSHFDTYLDYVKALDPKTADQIIPNGDPNQLVASIWEFRTVSPYTD